MISITAEAEMASRVLVVPHRVLIGMIAAQSAGINNPGEAFAFASDFPLSAADAWNQPRDDDTDVHAG